MTQVMPIVNASDLLGDDRVQSWLPALQRQADEFSKAWGGMAEELHLTFCPMSGIAGLDPGDWPIFLNRHSQEAGDLGWHTREGVRVYGRVFVGDCLRFGIEVSADISHEMVETQLDPTAERTYRMDDGTLAALEAADAVEADASGYRDGGVLLSNWVTPDYFSNRQGLASSYDRCGMLRAPCPALLPGGYMDIYAGGKWSTRQLDRDGLPGRRLLLPRHRRQLRQGEPDQSMVLP
jgi:hypothetical protein